MRGCIAHATSFARRLLLGRGCSPTRAPRFHPRRNGRMTAMDGPFAETKELLAAST